MIKYKKLPVDIFDNIKTAKRVLLQEENVLFAYLFGGLVRGKTPLSDIDMAIYLRDTKDISGYTLKLYHDLTESLNTDELDLVILNSASIGLAGRILMNKRIIVDKKPFERHSYESLTLRKYFDFKFREEALFKRRYSVG